MSQFIIERANIWQGNSPSIYYFVAPQNYHVFDAKMRSFRVKPGQVLKGVSLKEMVVITEESEDPAHNVWKTYFPVRGIMEFKVPVSYKGKDGFFMVEGDIVTFFKDDDIQITPRKESDSRYEQLPLMVMWFAKPCSDMVSNPKIVKQGN